ncbi:MAG TPA: flagellar biosynthesis repressor FlbT [Arenibaculum sp.]|nr:flagellar biosynthesis repressor FlbT [Arenibaculum sp.]
MALKLRLKPNERVVINGCVVQNDNRRYTLTVGNFAQIIRGSDILQEEDADTPVRRAYFIIQTMLLDPASARTYEDVISTSMAKLYAAFQRPDICDRIMQAMHHVGEADYYQALVCLRPVMAYEETVLPGVRPLRERSAEQAAL